MAEKKYGKYTEEQVRQANLVNLEVLLEQQGERLIRSGKEMRMERNHSVTVRGNRWYDHAEERGGYALSFVRKYMNLSFDEAMQLLIGDGRVVSLSDTKQNKRESKAFALPEQNDSMRRLYAYLLSFRKIDKSVLNAFVQAKLIYEDKPYHNAVFVGRDENNVARHAHKRSTNSVGKVFRINVEGSNPAYSFHWKGNSEKLYVFEAPIDLLSYISLHPDNWKEHSYVSLCGVSEQAMLKQLELRKQISEVYLCFDNDAAGQAATKRLTERLRSLGDWKVEQLCPQYKDWNDDLKESCNEQKGEMTLAI